MLGEIGKGNEGTAYYAIPRDLLTDPGSRTPDNMLEMLEVVKINHKVEARTEDEREVRVMQSKTYKRVAGRSVPALRASDPEFGYMSSSYAGVGFANFVKPYETTASKKPFPAPMVWFLLKSVVRTLAFLHSGVDRQVRRGMKEPPSNHKAVTHSDLVVVNMCLRRTSDGRIKLTVIDFGHGETHPEHVGKEAGDIPAARKDVAYSAECFSWLLERQIPEHQEILDFMARMIDQARPDRLTAREALAMMDDPEFWENGFEKILHGIPSDFEKVFDALTPKGEDLLRMVESIDELEERSKKSRDFKCVKRHNAQLAKISRKEKEAGPPKGKKRKHSDNPDADIEKPVMVRETRAARLRAITKNAEQYEAARAERRKRQTTMSCVRKSKGESSALSSYLSSDNEAEGSKVNTVKAEKMETGKMDVEMVDADMAYRSSDELSSPPSSNDGDGDEDWDN